MPLKDVQVFPSTIPGDCNAIRRQIVREPRIAVSIRRQALLHGGKRYLQRLLLGFIQILIISESGCIADLFTVALGNWQGTRILYPQS